MRIGTRLKMPRHVRFNVPLGVRLEIRIGIRIQENTRQAKGNHRDAPFINAKAFDDGLPLMLA